jgi:2-polyprenyl-6-methoxyphenol hydroxylase-like FAD-dependent oxidoreductase
MLVRAGWHVEIFEKVRDSLASRGAGIARHPEMAPIMEAAGVAADRFSGIEVEGRTAYDRSGAIIARHGYRQFLSAWNRVFDPLHASFPAEHYHLGKELTAIEKVADTVTARFADGAVAEADLIIGADGFLSSVRAIFAPGTKPRYAGYVAWRGMLEEHELSERYRADTMSRYAFCFPCGSQLISYPLTSVDDSAEPGRRRYSFLWYYPVREGAELSGLLTDDSGVTHDYSIPPPLIRAAHVAHIKREAEALLPPQFAEVVIKAKRHMLQPIYDVESRRISFDRAALIGDAAFVARPHVGIGVLKAGEDALALARSLQESSSIEAGLARYEDERLDAGREAVELGRYLGAFIERGLEGPWSDPALDLTPEKVIRISARPITHFSERKSKSYELC